MKQTIEVAAERPLVTLMEGLTYTNAPDWYGVTGRSLQMDLILPRDREGIAPRPLLVWLCGGAFQHMSRSVWLPELQWYARNGFTVAAVDYRVGVNAAFPVPVLDARAAVRCLKAHAREWAIDPTRVALMGESAGAYIASMAALGDDRYDQGDWLEQSAAVQAVVSYYGKQDMDYDSEANRAAPGVVDVFMSGRRDAESVRAATPWRLVTPESPPFLLFHGDADPLVPIAESDEMYRALIEAGVNADYYVLHGAKHGTPEFYQPVVKRIVLSFLQNALAAEG